jgi:hypothetical protein
MDLTVLRILQYNTMQLKGPNLKVGFSPACKFISLFLFWSLSLDCYLIFHCETRIKQKTSGTGVRHGRLQNPACFISPHAIEWEVFLVRFSHHIKCQERSAELGDLLLIEIRQIQPVT